MSHATQQSTPSICQSCAMPLRTNEDFGTEAAGGRRRDYCAYCYRNGAFITKAMTMEQMRALCVDKMVELHVMPRDQALAHMQEALPKLKRWSQAKV